MVGCNLVCFPEVCIHYSILTSVLFTFTVHALYIRCDALTLLTSEEHCPGGACLLQAMKHFYTSLVAADRSKVVPMA